MPNTLSTSPAVMDRKQIVDHTLEQTKQQALEEAADKKMKVSEVQNVQREKISKLFEEQGSDLVTQASDESSVSDEIQADLEKGVKEQHAEHMKAVAPAPDAYVLPDEGTTVGLQHDNTRAIGIAGRALDSDRVAKHEAKHREQEAGDQTLELPPTGDPEIDEIRTLSRRALRENGAVKAEGGLKDHTPEYHEYVASSERIAKHLNKAGMDGEKLVEEAGDTNAGFEELHESMVLVSLKQRLAEEVPDAEKVLAA